MMWHAHPDLNPETAETKAPTATPISPVYKQLKKFHDEADPDAAIRKEAHKLQMVAEGKSLSGLMELQQPGRGAAPPPPGPQSIGEVLMLAQAQAQAEAAAATQQVIEDLVNQVSETTGVPI